MIRDAASPPGAAKMPGRAVLAARAAADQCARAAAVKTGLTADMRACRSAVPASPCRQAPGLPGTAAMTCSGSRRRSATVTACCALASAVLMSLAEACGGRPAAGRALGVEQVSRECPDERFQVGLPEEPVDVHVDHR